MAKHSAAESSKHEAHPNYWLIGIVLAVLTGLELTVTSNWFTSTFNLSQVLTDFLLLAFAIGKALFVVGYYMHLKFDSRIFTVMFSIGILFALLLSTTFMLLF